MLTLTSLIISTLLASVLAIFMYRSLHRAQNFKQSISSPRKRSGQGRRGVQHGFILLQMFHRSHKENIKQIKLRSPRSGISAPWGW